MKVLAFLILCFTTAAFGDDFKLGSGKEYKNVTVTRVEPDGIVLKTKSGISKVYFVELQKGVQERFHYNAAIANTSHSVIDRYRFLCGLVCPVQTAITEPRANGEE